MSTSAPPIFDYDAIPVGYYDEIFQRRRGVQSKWHHLKFKRVREEFPPAGVHVDVACGPGTFIGTLPSAILSTGLDISEPQINFARGKYASESHRFDTMAPAHLNV